MSSQNPPTPRSRRRIAGERRPERPDPAVEQPAPSEPDDVVDSTDPDTVAPRPARPAQSGPSTPVLVGLAVLAVVLLATVAVLGLGVWDIREVRDQEAVDEASRTAPAAAERAADAILSYNYKSLDADQQAAEKFMTPEYRTKEYVDTFKLVQENAPKLKARVEADVRASAVTEADEDRADILVYVNQTTTSTANGGEPQRALNRVRFAMVKRDGAWLVNGITSY